MGAILLTIGVFTSAFFVISFISVYFTREKITRSYKGSDYLNSLTTYSKIRAFYGIALIVTTYILAFVVGHTSLIGLTLLIPFSATFGTYYFSVILYLVFRFSTWETQISLATLPSTIASRTNAYNDG